MRGHISTGVTGVANQSMEGSKSALEAASNAVESGTQNIHTHVNESKISHHLAASKVSTHVSASKMSHHGENLLDSARAAASKASSLPVKLNESKMHHDVSKAFNSDAAKAVGSVASKVGENFQNQAASGLASGAASVSSGATTLLELGIT